MLFKKNEVENVKERIEIVLKEYKDRTLCFTGHRPQKLPWGFNEEDKRCLNIKKELYSIIEESIKKGYKIFLSGMALGFDMICAETILELKKKYKDIKLVAALPCKNQDCKWNSVQQKRYRNLLKKADSIRCIYDDYIGPECMLERNEYMVNASSKMIALFDGKPGGTKKTIDYAKSKGLDVVIIKA